MARDHELRKLAQSFLDDRKQRAKKDVYFGPLAHTKLCDLAGAVASGRLLYREARTTINELINDPKLRTTAIEFLKMRIDQLGYADETLTER